jgi:hypothetical protein
MIEIARPKMIRVGSRVRCSEAVGTKHVKGAIGTVKDAGPRAAIVEFDEDIGSPLLREAGTDGRYWWCFKEDLEVIR